MEAKRIEGDLWDFGTAVADSGMDRLCLRYVGEEGFDFHELAWESNCVPRQAPAAILSHHGVLVLSMALRIVRSLRMHATIATLGFFPAVLKR
jgi:hypothetical protein